MESGQMEDEENSVREDGCPHHHEAGPLLWPDDLRELPGDDAHRKSADPPPHPVRGDVEQDPERGNTHSGY